MKKPVTEPSNIPGLAEEAKAIVALAFRNGPIEDIHAGKTCPTCHGDSQYSHITDDEIRLIMTAAVNCMYRLLVLKEIDPDKYQENIEFGRRYTRAWDEPNLRRDLPSWLR